MAKRKPKLPSLPRPFIKTGLVLIVVAVIAFIFFNQLAYFFRNSDYFNIAAIHPDPSLDFIKEQDLDYLKGQNIFSVDLTEVQEHLALRYPQVIQLRVVKRFPNEIVIVAQKRIPFAQVELSGRLLTIDPYGVVLSMTAQDSQLPFIVGVKTQGKIALGLTLQSQNLPTALRILKSFKSQDSLNNYVMTKINVGNLSEINLYLSNHLNIILDAEAIAERLKLLSVVLSQKELDLQTIKYIDLRFKEPILGKKQNDVGKES